jgi:SAM-dependent methyltransferase
VEGETLETDVKKFWDDAAATYERVAYQYGRSPDSRYPFYEVRRERVMDIVASLPKGRCLDAGCGGGQVMLSLLQAGWDASGLDVSPKMLELAADALEAAGHSRDRLVLGSLDDLSHYESDSMDLITSMGVQEYLTQEQELRFFAEARRILRPGGILIVEYINMLFDLTTFNRFTIHFFQSHLLPPFFADGERVLQLTERLKTLLTFADKPDRSGRYSTTRDQVYNRTENPLTFPRRVRERGFEQRDLVFYRFHAVPPLLFEAEPELEKVSIDFEKTYCRDWIGYFLATGFISSLQRLPSGSR